MIKTKETSKGIVRQLWCIKRADKDELWQNGEGWVGVEQMDSISVFDEREKNAIKNLPHGGEWVLCWSVPK